MDDEIGYRRLYKLRTAVPGRKTIEVTFPYEVVERQARLHGLTVPEFLQQFQAVAHFNNFEGVRYTFEKQDNDSKGDVSSMEVTEESNA